jgi:hypothetical protein
MSSAIGLLGACRRLRAEVLSLCSDEEWGVRSSGDWLEAARGVARWLLIEPQIWIAT